MKKLLLSILFALGLGYLGLGQQVIGSFPSMDGGFEVQSSDPGGTLYQTTWSHNGTSATLSTSGGRSGPHFISFIQTGSSHKRLISPNVTGWSNSTAYTVQFYFQGDLDGTVSGDIRGGLTPLNTNTSAFYYSSYTNDQNTGATWTLFTGTATTSTLGTGNGNGIFSVNNTGNFKIDDFVVYAGAVDNTAPDSPGEVTVANATSNSLDVSWIATSAGVDGGGYVVVRYSSNPNADNDPNQKGIYAMGNTTTNGTGNLTGTVRYIGTGVTFTDIELQPNTQYWYKVYTVDKAFNYSAESSNSGSTAAGTPTAETPTFDPIAGNYLTTQNVTISTTTPAATIYYTTNGNDPDNTSTEYTVPVEITSTTTLKAIAYATDYNPSSIGTAVYTFPIEVANISELRAGTTGGTVYKLTGEAILTYKTANRNAKYIQDVTGAVLIDDNAGIITTNYNLYDGISGITGTLAFYNSMLQFTPIVDPGTATSTENTVTPIEVTLANLTTDYQGKLVIIKNATITGTGNFVASTNYVLTDASGAKVLRTSYTDLNYIGSPIPVVQQDLTGVVLQYTTSMQLVPRSLSDFSNSPGYQLIGASDNASNYGDSWSGNGGYGFGAWNLYIDGGTSSDAGHYLGNSTVNGHGNINSSDNRSFGMYGNNSKYANAERSLPYWGDGATFSIQLAVKWRNGNRGISLFNSNGFAGGDEIWNFNINDAGYGSTGWGYHSDMVLNFDITQIGADLSINVTGTSLLDSWNASVNYVLTSKSLGGIRLYTGGGTGGNEGERNLYVNNLQINTDEATIPLTGNVYVKGQVDIGSTLSMSSNLLIESGHILRINPTGQLTVSGGITNTNGTNGLVIESDDAQTGSLIHNSNNINATIERYLTGNTSTSGTYDFHLVSVPFNADKTANLFNGMYLYHFNQATQLWASMGADPATVLDNNEGYMVFYPNTSTTASMTGQLNNGSFTAVTGTDAADEFSLVPNPYPSAIDWDAASGWTKTGLNNYFYIWDPVGNNYVAWGSGAGQGTGTPPIGTATSGIIPVGQAFFVKSSATTAVLSMTNSVRVHNTQPFYKQTENTIPEVFRLKVNDSESYDQMIVRFNNEASNGRGFLDVDKLYGADIAPQLYSLTDAQNQLTINALPHSNQTIVVPVGLEFPADQTLTFTATGFESFESSVSIFLEDKLLNKTVDLRQNPVYTFTHSTASDTQRFNLLFYGVNGTSELPTEKNYSIWVSNDHINILIPAFTGQKAMVELIDNQFRVLSSQQTNLSDPTIIRAPKTSGIYIVRVVTGNQVYSSKVFIR